MSLIIGYFGVN